MEPRQRTEREMTYQVGWKRGKIKRNSNCTGQKVDKNGMDIGISSLMDWNLRWMWRPAGTIKSSVLQAVLWAFPAVVFVLSLWLIYQLSFHP